MQRSTDIGNATIADVNLAYLELYVPDTTAATEYFAQSFGFARFGVCESASHRTVGLAQGAITLLLTEPKVFDHPGSRYVTEHGAGVADIAMRTGNARAAYQAAIAAGAQSIAEPIETTDGWVRATVTGLGDLAHTFVQPRTSAAAATRAPGLTPVGDIHLAPLPRLYQVDHLAICLPTGQLGPVSEFYCQGLGFRQIFDEQVTLEGRPAMDSVVVQSLSGSVTLTLIEPSAHATRPGQIDEFLAEHRGPGVQHIAFTTDDIVTTVSALTNRGVAFLPTPAAYYNQLPQRLLPSHHSIANLAKVGVLADEDHHGQLYQIFTRSIHPRRTLFFELIERFGATTFGAGNIEALYAAVAHASRAERQLA
ncbi:4-hydroxyphenylpyruvate dioxygenase [Sphaerisporangium flaviroseum]|uniref:4-hydroxyphenylpyruvate dioxygenase n=1 Tax=Sphaerisporangium flaviroseum TaxID=509199 RepID=A0ABP7J1Q5_9ACTN